MPRPRKGVIEQSITDEIIQTIEKLPAMACLNKKDVFNSLCKLKIISISYHTYQHWQTEYNKFDGMSYEQYRKHNNKETIKKKQLSKNEWYFCELIPKLLYSPVSIMRQQYFDLALQSDNPRDKAEWLKMYDLELKRELARIEQEFAKIEEQQEDITFIDNVPMED